MAHVKFIPVRMEALPRAPTTTRAPGTKTVKVVFVCGCLAVPTRSYVEVVPVAEHLHVRWGIHVQRMKCVPLVCAWLRTETLLTIASSPQKTSVWMAPHRLAMMASLVRIRWSAKGDCAITRLKETEPTQRLRVPRAVTENQGLVRMGQCVITTRCVSAGASLIPQ